MFCSVFWVVSLDFNSTPCNGIKIHLLKGFSQAKANSIVTPITNDNNNLFPFFSRTKPEADVMLLSY